MRSVWERWTKIVPVFYIPSCKAGAPLSACVVCLQTIHMHSSLEPVRFGSRFFCLCGDTRKKIVAIQIALFSACVDTRKNSRDLNRDSNRAFLVCGNAPILSICCSIFGEHCAWKIFHLTGDCLCWWMIDNQHLSDCSLFWVRNDDLKITRKVIFFLYWKWPIFLAWVQKDQTKEEKEKW